GKIIVSPVHVEASDDEESDEFGARAAVILDPAGVGAAARPTDRCVSTWAAGRASGTGLPLAGCSRQSLDARFDHGPEGCHVGVLAIGRLVPLLQNASD